MQEEKEEEKEEEAIVVPAGDAEPIVPAE